VLAEVPKDIDVLLVAAAALDQPDRAAAGELLDVVDRRLVEVDELGELQDAVVDVQQRHVAAEAAASDTLRLWFCHSSHLPFAARLDRRSRSAPDRTPLPDRHA
jgi:hypothetical protein